MKSLLRPNQLGIVPYASDLKIIFLGGGIARSKERFSHTWIVMKFRQNWNYRRSSVLSFLLSLEAHSQHFVIIKNKIMDWFWRFDVPLLQKLVKLLQLYGITVRTSWYARCVRGHRQEGFTLTIYYYAMVIGPLASTDILLNKKCLTFFLFDQLNSNNKQYFFKKKKSYSKKEKNQRKPLYFNLSPYWLQEYSLRKIWKSKDQIAMAL